MRMPVAGVVVLASLLLVPAVHAGKLYKWVDAEGRVSYQDRPPPSGSGHVEERDVGDNGVDSGSKADIPADVLAKFPVVVYGTPKCGTCISARAHLKRRHVPFRDVNLDGNARAQQEVIQKFGELTMPIITVGDKVMKGYLDSLLDGELDSAGYPKAAGAAASTTTGSTETEPEAEPEAAQ